MKSTDFFEAEVLKELSSIEQMEIGTEQHKVAVDTVTKLTDKMIDLKKVELEEKKMANENLVDFEKEKRDQKDQKVKNGIAIAGIIAPLIVGIWANIYNWYKEADGIMSSTGGKKAIDFLTRLGRK